MNSKEYMTIDGIPVAIEGEKNLLELINKTGIKILPHINNPLTTPLLITFGNTSNITAVRIIKKAVSTNLILLFINITEFKY